MIVYSRVTVGSMGLPLRNSGIASVLRICMLFDMWCELEITMDMGKILGGR